jgi:endonuclease I
VLEWEHVAPPTTSAAAALVARKDMRNASTHPAKAFKGRECCARVDSTFTRMEADRHNLTPAVGELNDDRSNVPFGEVYVKPVNTVHAISKSEPSRARRNPEMRYEAMPKGSGSTCPTPTL